MAKRLTLRVLLFAVISIVEMVLWIGAGALFEETKVANASWLEYSFALFTIWTISTIIIESIAQNSTIRVLLDLFFIIGAIVVVIVPGGFSVSFISTPETIRNMIMPAGITLALAIVITVPELVKELKNKKNKP